MNSENTLTFENVNTVGTGFKAPSRQKSTFIRNLMALTSSVFSLLTCSRQIKCPRIEAAIVIQFATDGYQEMQIGLDKGSCISNAVDIYRALEVKYYSKQAHNGCQNNVVFTETLSFRWNFRHWLHCKLSNWQLPVQLVIKISLKRQYSRFGSPQGTHIAVTSHERHGVTSHRQLICLKQRNLYFWFDSNDISSYEYKWALVETIAWCRNLLVHIVLAIIIYLPSNI